MEAAIAEIIATYGAQLWMSFVTLVITGFVLTMCRNFVQDVVYYFKARISDIGFGQKIYWRGELYLVEKVHFKYITIKNKQKLVRIPIRNYMSSATEFPVYDFDKELDEETNSN